VLVDLTPGETGTCYRNNGRLFVGNLPFDVRERDLDDLFYKYGRIRSIDIKGGRDGAPFAFVEFDDPRDADDAAYGRDGIDFLGGRIRVEKTRGPGPRGAGGVPLAQNGGGPRSFGGNRSEHRIFVSPIPPGGSWQDLKDFCKEAGMDRKDMLYAEVKGTEGTVEFVEASLVDRAVRELDNRTFRTHTGESGTVQVRSDGAGDRRDDDRRDDDRRDDDRRDDDRRDDDRRDDDRRSDDGDRRRDRDDDDEDRRRDRRDDYDDDRRRDRDEDDRRD